MLLNPKNDDSRRKLCLGKIWASMAGDRPRYYMVLQDNVDPLEGALTTTQFLNILAQL